MRHALAVLLLLLSLSSAILASEEAGRDVLVPIVGRGPGASGSMWQTDLILTNNTATYKTLELKLEFNDGQPTTVNVSISARSSVVLEDVVRTIFGRDTATGSLRVRASVSDARILARAWIYNATAEKAGRFGQHVPGVPVEQLATFTVLNLGEPASGTRTNLGVSNPSDEPASADVITGLFSRQSIQVPPHGVVQLNDIYRSIPNLGTNPIYVRADRPVYTYASVIDTTGDPLFLAGAGAELAAPVTPACAQPLELHRNPKDEFVAPGYIVLLRSVGEIDATLTKYGIVPGFVLRAVGGFYAELTPETVAALRCDPRGDDHRARPVRSSAGLTAGASGRWCAIDVRLGAPQSNHTRIPDLAIARREREIKRSRGCDNDAVRRICMKGRRERVQRKNDRDVQRDHLNDGRSGGMQQPSVEWYFEL